MARRLRPLSRRRTVAAVAALLAVQIGLLVAYLRWSSAIPRSPRYYAYPLAWTTAAAWALLRVPAPEADRRGRAVAAAVAVGYFLLVARLTGALRLGETGSGAAVHWLAPGWGPLVTYDGAVLSAVAVPFQVVGYLALAYLVYALVGAGRGLAAAGAGGLATCVGCAWPVLGALGGGLAGAGVLGAVAGLSYDLSTALFLATTAVMYWGLTRDRDRPRSLRPATAQAD